jgi:hypothetical protein
MECVKKLIEQSLKGLRKNKAKCKKKKKSNVS